VCKEDDSITMAIGKETDPIKLKEIGNEAFKSGDFDEALSAYTKAMDIAGEEKNKDADLAVLHKNRAAVHLKNEDYQDAVDDCTKSLELVCPKHGRRWHTLN
jgi:tetratricopeptide (TPR) repeat protein